MKIYKRIIICLLLVCCSARIMAEQYIYVKGMTSFEIKENKNDYEVICFRKGTSITSRNKNITDRQLRLEALDLIGAYIIYKNEYADRIRPEYFQMIVDGIDLHYNAVIEDVRQEQNNIDGSLAISYYCSKNKYKIEYATYKKDLDLFSLVSANYTRNKNGNTANLFYEFSDFNSHCYIKLEDDFHKGNAVVPTGIRMLLQINDRFERSIYSENEEQLNGILMQVNKNLSEKEPYSRFCLEELITSVPLKKKKGYYLKWQESMQMARTVWEDALYYCSQDIERNVNIETACFTDVISSFIGAISPFGIRQPINNASYIEATKAYSKSDFQKTVEILRESIDTEGISSESLNLLGASYRFLNKPQDALPFLILAFKLNPKTQYLVGNIALCLNMIDYPQMDEVCNFLMNYAVDEWSKNEIKNIQIQ